MTARERIIKDIAARSAATGRRQVWTYVPKGYRPDNAPPSDILAIRSSGGEGYEVLTRDPSGKQTWNRAEDGADYEMIAYNLDQQKKEIRRKQ